MNFSGNMRRNNMKMPVRGGGVSGPLMTDHLHDLELELELLKRKRQLIQHQQSEMLYNRTPGSNNMRFNQPSQSYNDQFNEPQNLNFSHLYNESPRDDRSFGLKRRAQADWSSGPSDRFDAPIGNKRSRPAPFDHYPEQNNTFQRPMPNQPQPLLGVPKPLMNFPTQGRRAQNQGPKPFNQSPKPFNQSPKPFNQSPKTFNQSPKPFNQGPKPFNQGPGPKPFNQGPRTMNQGPRPLNQGPKPLTQHPNFKRKQPGPNRPGFSPKKTTPGANFRPNFNPNKTLTPKKNSPVKAFNANPRVKKTPVLLADEQPSNKTNGRLELALGMIMKEIKVTYGRTPEYGEFFATMPMNRIMKQGVRDRLRSVMTGKVVGIVPDIVAEYRNAYPLETDKDIVELAAAEKRNSEHTTELVIKLFEEGDPEEYFKKHMGRILDARWTDILRKLEKVIYEENKELTDAMILEKLPEIKKSSETPEKSDEKPTDVTATEEAAEKPAAEEAAEKSAAEEAAEKSAAEEAVEKPTDEKPVADTPAVEDKTEPTDVTPTEVVDKTAKKPIVIKSKEHFYGKWMGILLERKLPHLLFKNKEKIIRLFELDNMYRNTKAAVIINTNKKSQGLSGKGRQSTGGQASGDPQMPRGDWLFVKVLAIPSMPKRKIMQEFLNQFKPKTIKRHKKNYNLLFVGLDTQENYDKMLAANETIIGNTTITISPSNVSKTTPGAAEVDLNKSDADLDQVLTPQLDDQINDLLSSIRKADEEAQTEGDTANIDLTNTDSAESNAADSNGDVKAEENGNQEAQEGATNENAENGNAEAKDDEVQVVEDSNAAKDVVTIEDDEVPPLKSDEVKQAAKGPGTPAKGRAPATPSSIRTRRSSRLLN